MNFNQRDEESLKMNLIFAVNIKSEESNPYIYSFWQAMHLTLSCLDCIIDPALLTSWMPSCSNLGCHPANLSALASQGRGASSTPARETRGELDAGELRRPHLPAGDTERARRRRVRPAARARRRHGASSTPASLAGRACPPETRR